MFRTGRKVLVNILEDYLCIPAEEPEPLTVLSPTAQGIPIVMVPVGVASILIDEHVVDEMVDIEQRVEFGVTLCIGSIGRRIEHLFPGIECTLGSLDMIAAILFDLNHIDVTFLATEMILTKLSVDTLGDIIESPIHTIKK